MEDFEAFKRRVDLWKATRKQCWMETTEELAPGIDESWEYENR